MEENKQKIKFLKVSNITNDILLYRLSEKFVIKHINIILDKMIDLKYITEEDKIVLKKELIKNKFKFIKNTTYESIKDKKIS